MMTTAPAGRVLGDIGDDESRMRRAIKELLPAPPVDKFREARVPTAISDWMVWKTGSPAGPSRIEGRPQRGGPGARGRSISRAPARLRALSRRKYFFSIPARWLEAIIAVTTAQTSAVPDPAPSGCERIKTPPSRLGRAAGNRCVCASPDLPE